MDKATLRSVNFTDSISNNIQGLEISNGTDTDHDIDIAVGSCIDSTGAYPLKLTSGLTKQIDATWAVGTNAGGLDTGSVANNTWYYIWLIRKDSDGSIDVLFSISKTSPTMPSGYTYKRRIRGAVLTNGSANILGFFQKDNYFCFTTQSRDYQSITPGTSRVLITVSIPPDTLGFFDIIFETNTGEYFLIGSTNESDVAPSSSYYTKLTDAYDRYCTMHREIYVDNNSQIYLRSSRASLNGALLGVMIETKGFIDNAQD